MKKSEVYKKAIDAVAKAYEGEELREMLRMLMDNLDVAEWVEAEEEKRNGESS